MLSESRNCFINKWSFSCAGAMNFDTLEIRRALLILLLIQTFLYLLFYFIYLSYLVPVVSFQQRTFSSYIQMKDTTPSSVATDDLTWIDKNPIYSRFNISAPRENATRKRVSILIVVSSAPRRFERRQAIRDTWWNECKLTKSVSICYRTTGEHFNCKTSWLN